MSEKIGAGAGKAFLRTGLKELQNVFSMGSTVGNEPGSLGTPTIQQVHAEITESAPQASLDARIESLRDRSTANDHDRGHDQ